MGKQHSHAPIVVAASIASAVVAGAAIATYEALKSEKGKETIKKAKATVVNTAVKAKGTVVDTANKAKETVVNTASKIKSKLPGKTAVAEDVVEADLADEIPETDEV